MTNAIVAVATFALLLSSVPGHATGKGRHGPSGALVYHGETPPGALLSFSVANAGPARDGNQRASCERVEAILHVLGTLAPAGRENGDVRMLELLHRSRFVLSPGEVQPFEFRQASSSPETVIVQTIVSEHAAQCLAHSSVSVSNVAGDLLSVVPPPPVGLVGLILILDGGGSSGRCCDCAPICECGLCPD